MKSSSITVVFFDAVGTLFHVKGSVGETYLRYAEKYGVKSTADQMRAVNQAFRVAFAEAPPPIFAVEQPEKLKQCERLWWFDIVHAVFYRVGMFEGFDDYFEEVYEAFGGSEPWQVYPDVPGALEQLRGEGYELGVISNFDTRFFGILQALGLKRYFDSITISSLAGSAKPSQKIFQYALDHHAVDPGEAVHVGDSLREDVEGSSNAKLIGVLLDREGETAGDTESTIRSLHDLPKLLSSF